jgi:hypothetical protein
MLNEHQLPGSVDEIEKDTPTLKARNRPWQFRLRLTLRRSPSPLQCHGNMDL